MRILFVFHIYRLGTLSSLYPQRCKLILRYLSSLKQFTILNLYYLKLTKENMYY